MDTRPVIVRTDASANDFWSRVRDSSDVSPEFRVKGHVLSQRNTPFGIQVDPFDMRRPVHGLPPSMRSSRSVERIVLQKAIGDAEKENTNKYNALHCKYKYEFLHKDGPEALDGLVNPNSEEGEERTNEVMEYLESKCSEEFAFNPPSRVPICFSFTLAHV